MLEFLRRDKIDRTAINSKNLCDSVLTRREKLMQRLTKPENINLERVKGVSGSFITGAARWQEFDSSASEKRTPSNPRDYSLHRLGSNSCNPVAWDLFGRTPNEGVICRCLFARDKKQIQNRS